MTSFISSFTSRLAALLLVAFGCGTLDGPLCDSCASGVCVGTGCAPTEEVAILVASGVASRDDFGVSVVLSADGTRALVGAPLDDTPAGFDVGSVRVFVRAGSTWTEEATLLASGGARRDLFGTSVALNADGTRALVGTTGYGAGFASARVFVRAGSTWTEEATLLASSGSEYDVRFESGWHPAVALSADGTRALVSCRHESVPIWRREFARTGVFARTGSTWTEEATLSGGAEGDYFGASVALSADGTRALVGAPEFRGGDREYGGLASARVFVRAGSTWTEEATLLPSGFRGSFGISVALSADGTRALVGAPEFLGGPGLGGAGLASARVFVRAGSTWTEEATLLPSGVASRYHFGISVALSADGTRALVGAPALSSRDRYYDPIGLASARVFVRAGSTWTEEATLLASGGLEYNPYFGRSVALSADGTRALVGALYDDTRGGTDTGSARVFSLP